MNLKEVEFKPFHYKHLIIFISLPLYYFVANLIAGQSSRPFYLRFNTDAPYGYLGSSLSIALNQVPGLFAHPGTPLQILFVGVQRIVYFYRNLFNYTSLTFPEDTLINSELYLSLLHGLVLALGMLILAASGILVFLLTHDYILSSLIQINPIFLAGFTSPISPEILLIVASQALTIPLIIYLFQPTVSQKNWYIAGLGILLGFGLAVKATFLPMLVFVFLIRRWSRILILFGAIALSFLIFTLPILSQYPSLIAWLFETAVYSGQYGSGDIGLPSEAYNVGGYLISLLQQHLIFFGLLYGATILYGVQILFSMLRQKPEIEDERDADPDSRQSNHQTAAITKSDLNAFYRLSTLVLLAFWGQVFLSFLEPNLLRYFVPAMSLLPILMLIIAQFIKLQFRGQYYTLKVGRLLLCFGLIVCVAMNIQQTQLGYARVNTKVAQANDDLVQVQRVLEMPQYQECRVVEAMGSLRPSTHIASLDIASFWAGDRFLDPYLANLYPNHIRLRASGHFFSYEKRLDAEQVLSETPCTLLLYRFASNRSLNRRHLTFTEVFHGHFEGLDEISLLAAS